MKNRIRIARGTSKELSQLSNSVNLPNGVPVYTTDDRKLHIGTGGMANMTPGIVSEGSTKLVEIDYSYEGGADAHVADLETGGSNNPVYFEDGIPKQCTNSLIPLNNYDSTKGTIEQRLTNLGFKIGDIVEYIGATTKIGEIKRQGNYVILNIQNYSYSLEPYSSNPNSYEDFYIVDPADHSQDLSTSFLPNTSDLNTYNYVLYETDGIIENGTSSPAYSFTYKIAIKQASTPQHFFFRLLVDGPSSGVNSYTDLYGELKNINLGYEARPINNYTLNIDPGMIRPLFTIYHNDGSSESSTAGGLFTNILAFTADQLDGYTAYITAGSVVYWNNTAHRDITLTIGDALLLDTLYYLTSNVELEIRA